MSKNTALHEILAVENGLAETANRIQKDTTKTLGTKQSLFTGLLKTHELFSEEMQQYTQAPDMKEVESTVNEQLEFAGNQLTNYWDASLQKEEANQRAFADITIGGNIIAEHVPSIVLLSMEKKLTSLISLYNAIPTLDASKAWELDDTYAKPGVYRTKHSTERQHNVTVKNWKEISPATKEFKAQLQQVEETTTVGKYISNDYSGAITSLDKANKIERLTALIRAVKTARQRANATIVNTELKIGKQLLDYING